MSEGSFGGRSGTARGVTIGNKIMLYLQLTSSVADSEELEVGGIYGCSTRD